MIDGIRRRSCGMLLVSLVAASTSGCMVPRSGIGFGAVAIDPLPLAPSLVKRNVSGEDCLKGKYGSYELAATRAIATASGANALTNVEFIVRASPTGETICVTVTGDAVRI